MCLGSFKVINQRTKKDEGASYVSSQLPDLLQL